MDANTIRTRLREAPFDFLSAVSSSTLPDFEKDWQALCKDVDGIMQLSLLNEDDIALAHATATHVAILGESFLDTNAEAVRRSAGLMDDMQNIFSQLALTEVDDVGQHAPLSRSSHRRRPRIAFGVAPSHIPVAYSWMLHNIHDPYPSIDVKERISQDAGRPLRVITDWFKDVRRHIGWVSMCKNYFKGSRALAVQAAKHVYLHRTDSAFHLSSTPEIVSQFEAIRIRLRDMYPVGDDNGDLSDNTVDSSTPSSSFRVSDQSLYARSRSSSSTPSLIFSTDDEDDHSLASFVLDDEPTRPEKRKTIEDDECRPLKRNRYGYIVADEPVKDVVSMSLAACDTSPSLSQPSASRKRRLSVVATEWEDATPVPSSSPQCASRPPLRISKRRLSVSDSQPTPKRPCLPPAVCPRKQAVSTPIPIAYQTTPAVDDWFPFELSDTSSVELFNWDGVIENDAFLYNSLFDSILQSDGQDFLNVTPSLDAYQPPTPLDLGVSSAVDPSVLDISSAFTEPPPTQLTAPVSTPPGPITATTTPVFDFLDAFLSAVNAESAEPHTTPSSSSPSTELSMNDTIDLFGESVVMP